MNDNNFENITYKQAIEEVEQLVRDIESGTLDLDELIKKVERATALIVYCKEKLKKSESNLDKIIKTLDKAE